MVNIFKSLTTYTVRKQKIWPLYWYLSPTNILISISKSDKIYFNNKMFIYAWEKTQGAQANKNNSVFARFFNLDLACK